GLECLVGRDAVAHQAKSERMMSRWIHRYLDPSDSLLEVLFVLVMAFTMTAGARLVFDAREFSAVELAIGLLGCNVAWGIIDAAFYLLGWLFVRNRRVLLWGKRR